MTSFKSKFVTSSRENAFVVHVFLLVLFGFVVVNTVLVLLNLLREKVVVVFVVVVVCFVPLTPRGEKIAHVAVCVAIFIPKCNREEDKDEEEDAARVVSFLRARVRESKRAGERADLVFFFFFFFFFFFLVLLFMRCVFKSL